MIRPLSKLSETRRRQIVSHVAAHLADDEAIVQVGRVRDPETGKQGFMFLTSERYMIRWRGAEEVVSRVWTDITAWGVNKDARRGPILTIESDDDEVSVQLQTGTRALASGASRVVKTFATLAPSAAGNVKASNHERVDPRTHVQVSKEKLTPGALARRILIGVLGAAFLILAVAIIPLPGPWSFLLALGALALLAREFDWAEDFLDWVKDKYEKAKAKVRSRRNK